MDIKAAFGAAADKVAKATGHPITFAICCLVIVVWAATGPVFQYSDTWQLIINTGTTIITFLMVFLIQNTQNRDSAAIQAKLDELLRSSAAQNTFIGIEHLSQEEVDAFRDQCAQSALKAKTSAAGNRAVAAAEKKATKAKNK